MRVGVLLVTAMMMGACASIVQLDDVDPSGSDASKTTADDDDDVSSSGGAGKDTDAMTSSGSSGPSASSSGGADSGQEAGSTSGVQVPARCDKAEDCPAADKDHAFCTAENKCEAECSMKNSFACIEEGSIIPGLRCCVGLTCKKESSPAGIPSFRCRAP